MTTGENITVLLLGRSAISAAPILERLCTQACGLPNVAHGVFAFSEQGKPSLRQVFDELVVAACGRILIVPVLLPAEPNFTARLAKILQRWQTENSRPWPEIRLAPLLTGHPAMPVLAAIVQSSGEPLPTPEKISHGAPGSAHKRCILVCFGGPCPAVGRGGRLAPFGQRVRTSVTPNSGRWHLQGADELPSPLRASLGRASFAGGHGDGGEAGMDKVVQDHLLGGAIVEELTDRRMARRQTLHS